MTHQNRLQYSIASEPEMLALGAALAKSCQQINTGCKIYLQGDLGTGKTTFVRGFLRALGYKEKVKSPTYTLLETYPLLQRNIYHLDLYRIRAADELEFIGIRDILESEAIILIEWPEHAKELLPPADLYCYIELSGNKRKVEIQAKNKIGQTILKKM